MKKLLPDCLVALLSTWILALVIEGEGELTSGPELEDATLFTTSTAATTTEGPSCCSVERRGDWAIVSRDSKNCFVSDFHGRLSIKAFGDCVKRQKHAKPTFIFFDEASKVEGICRRGESRSSTLILTTTTIHHIYSLIFHFVVVDTEGLPAKATRGITSRLMWKLETLNATCRPDKGSEAHAISDLRQISPVQAPLKQGFYCRHSVNLNLRPADKKNTDVEAKFQFAHNTRIKAFDVSDDPNFGNTYLCQMSRQIGLREQLETRSTIAMSVILVLGSVGTVGGYAVKRNWLQSKLGGYATMQ